MLEKAFFGFLKAWVIISKVCVGLIKLRKQTPFGFVYPKRRTRCFLGVSGRNRLVLLDYFHTFVTRLYAVDLIATAIRLNLAELEEKSGFRVRTSNCQ